MPLEPWNIPWGWELEGSGTTICASAFLYWFRSTKARSWPTARQARPKTSLDQSPFREPCADALSAKDFAHSSLMLWNSDAFLKTLLKEVHYINKTKLPYVYVYMWKNDIYFNMYIYLISLKILPGQTCMHKSFSLPFEINIYIHIYAHQVI